MADDSFAGRLRATISDEQNSKKTAVLAAVGEWIEDKILASLEHDFEKLAQEGESMMSYWHRYASDVYPYTDEIEALPSFQLLKSKTEQLGLDMIAMSHKRFGDRTEEKYPALEIWIKIPPAWKADYPHLKISSW
jgi:hypothetical protein